MQQFNYVIDEIPPSNNKYIGRNARWAYQSEKKRWAQLIQYGCMPKPKKPLEKAVVELTYFFKDKRRRDPDNYSGKFILDGLRQAGVIADDSFSNIELRLKADFTKEKAATCIKITEYSEKDCEACRYDGINCCDCSKCENSGKSDRLCNDCANGAKCSFKAREENG